MAKKKGGKNKLANMSEEDRIRHMQHLAEIEAEFKRRRQQLISAFMKNKLKREDVFTRLNLAKINQEWRSILRQLKCKELKDEVQALKQVCVDTIEHKNSIIKRLLSDLDESEELYSTLLNTHIESVAQLAGIHVERLDCLQEWFAKEKATILERCSHEIRNYKAKRFQAQKEIECVYYGMANEANQREKTLELEHMQKREDLKNKMMIRLDEITKVREQRMQLLWKEFVGVIEVYVKNTEEYRNEYIDLRQHDSKESDVIQDHYVDVADRTELIAELKIQISIVSDEHKFNMGQIDKYRKGLNLRIDQLKEEIDLGNADDFGRLRRMVVFSAAAMKRLQKLCKKGERILLIAGFCQRQETDIEQTDRKRVKRAFLQITEEEMRTAPAEFDAFKLKALDTAQRLEKFWRRYNNAKIDCCCLREEKLTLQADNHRLRLKIKNYLMTVNMATGCVTNSGHNVDYATRPQSMRVERVIHIDIEAMKAGRKTKRPVTCIEANLSVAVRSERLMTLKNVAKSIRSIVR